MCLLTSHGGQSTNIIEKYHNLAESKRYARCSKSVLGGSFIQDIIGSLSKQIPSPYFDIAYTPDWLRNLGISDYDLSILSVLPCHGDSLREFGIRIKQMLTNQVDIFYRADKQWSPDFVVCD